MTLQPMRFSRLIWLTILLFSGCTALKQCAYEGWNRDRWQQPDKVIQALDLKPGDGVTDLGSGSGYFTLRLARAVGTQGKIYAVDVDASMNALVMNKASSAQLTNIQAVLAAGDNSRLPPASVDLVFTVNTYHHLGDPVKYFTTLKSTLKPGGRIAIIDFDERGWLENFVAHATPAAAIKQAMEQAGYRLIKTLTFLDRQSFQIFAPQN